MEYDYDLLFGDIPEEIEDETLGLPKIKKSPGFFGSIERGIDQVQATLYGAVGMAGGAAEKVIGIGDSVKDWGIQGYLRNIAEAEENAPTVALKDIKNDLHKLPTWVIEQLGGVLPSMGEVLITSLLGMVAAGSPAGAPIGAFAGRTILKKSIKKALEKELKGKVLEKGAKEAIEKEITKAAFKNLGAKIGMVAGVFPMEAGGNYAEVLTEHGVDSPASAILTGMAATSLEFLGGNIRLIDKFMPVGTSTAFKKALKDGNTTFIKRAAKEILKNAPAEFVQEAGQEFLSAINIVVNTDERLFTPEVAERVLESGAVGMLAGGVGGLVGGIKSGPNVDKVDMLIAKQIESTPAIEEKEVLFERLVNRINKTDPSISDIDQAIAKEKLDIAGADSISSGMTEDQVTRQKAAIDDAAAKEKQAQVIRQEQAVAAKVAKDEQQKKDIKAEEAQRQTEAAKQQDKHRELLGAHLKSIETPEGLMSVTANTIAGMEQNDDNRKVVSVITKAYKSLRGNEDSLKNLNSELTDLELAKINATDDYERSIIEGLRGLVSQRVSEVTEAERLKEEAKAKEKPVTAAKVAKARPTVAKRKIIADQVAAVKAIKRTAEKAKVAAAKPVTATVPKKSSTQITKESLERKRVGAKRKIEADKAARKGPFKYSEPAPAAAAAKGEPASVAQREMHRTNIETDLKGFTEHLANVTNIKVVKNVKDAPKYLRDKVAADKVTPYALYDPNTQDIYIFSDTVKSADEAKFEAWHELGHYSFEQLFGEKKAKSILDGIATKFPKEIAAKRGINASEEVLIDKFLANDKSTIITKVRHMFRKLADKLSGEKKITDHEINTVVKQMRENLKIAKKVAVEKPVAAEVKYSEFIKEKGRVKSGSAAVKIDGKIYGPAQTHWQAATSDPNNLAPKLFKEIEDGFLTDKGVFVTREEALELVPKDISDKKPKGKFISKLISEDLEYIDKTIKYSEAQKKAMLPKDTSYDYFNPVDSKTFITTRNKNKRLQYMTAHDENKLSKARLFMLSDYDVGYGIMPDGEIFNSFNNSKLRGAGALAKISAVMNGGTWLNNYDGFLTKFNESLGFKVTERKAWDEKQKPVGWVEEDGKPDYITMEYKGETYDPLVIAGMYEAAWDKRLDIEPASRTILNSLTYRPQSATRREVDTRKQAKAAERTEAYLTRSWGDYQKGAVDTAPESSIFPTKNILITKSKAVSKKGRTVLIQTTSNNTIPEASTEGDAYFNKLYRNRSGYSRPVDFWELPQWAAEAAHSIPKADTYIVRNIEEAIAFLESTDYDAAMFSVMDANKVLVKRIVERTSTKIIAGGYVTKDYFKDNKNVTYVKDVKEGVEKLNLKHKSGTDYTAFANTPTIPRLECSQGCKHSCSFCTVPKKITMPKSDDISAQIKAFKDLDFKLVYLNDKTFGQAINYKNLVRFNKEMKKINPNFEGFIIQTTAPALLKMSDTFLQESGIKYVELGVETYNDDILKNIKKPHTTNLIDQAVEKLRLNNINFIPNIMIGLAGVKNNVLWTETKDTYQNTLDFLNKNKDIISHTNPYVLAVYEGTETNKQLSKGIETDSDENVINKSWLKNKTIHQNFYRDVIEFSTNVLETEPTVKYSAKEYTHPTAATESKGIVFIGADGMGVDWKGVASPDESFRYPNYHKAWTVSKKVATMIHDHAAKGYTHIAVVTYKHVRDSMRNHPHFREALRRAMLKAHGKEKLAELIEEGQKIIDKKEAAQVKLKKPIAIKRNNAELVAAIELGGLKHGETIDIARELAVDDWKDKAGKIVGIGIYGGKDRADPSDMYGGKFKFDSYHELPTPIGFTEFMNTVEKYKEGKHSVWMIMNQRGFVLNKKEHPMSTKLMDAATGKFDELQAELSKQPALTPEVAVNVKYSMAPAVETKAFKDWFGKSKVKEGGKPKVVYHGTLADFDEFKVGDIGYHFGTAKQAGGRLEASTWFDDDASQNIMPVYLKLENPLRIMDVSSFNSAFDIAKELFTTDVITNDEFYSLDEAKDNNESLDMLKAIIQKKGYDGLIYLNRREGVTSVRKIIAEEHRKGVGDEQLKEKFPELKDSYIVFKSNQVKSAIGNVGTYDPTKADIRYSTVGTWRDSITDPADKAVVDGIGYIHKEKEKTVNAIGMKWSDYLIRTIADSKHAQRVLEKTQDLTAAESGYKAIRMISSFPTIFKQFLEQGTAKFDKTDQWITIDQRNSGLFQAIRKLEEGEVEPFFLWFTALSGQELLGKDRSKLFGKDLEDQKTIDDLIRITKGAYDANSEVWEEVRTDLRDINTEFLNFMEDAGIIDPVQRKKWERKDYVPYTRMVEDVESGELETLYQNAGGKDVKQVIRTFKGGENRIGDPIANLVNNYSFMMNEALTNVARRKSIQVMKNAGLAKSVSKKTEGQNVFKVYNKGKAEYIEVDDPMLADTIADLHGASKGSTSRWLTYPKKLLTWAVTIMPAFRVANTVRDAAHTALIEASFNPFIDSYKGFLGAMRNSPEMVEFAATGGAFSGSYYVRDIGKKPLAGAIEKLRKGIHKKTASKPYRIYDIWERIGEASENAARLGLYMKLRAKGETKLEAGYRAKDLLDFYQSGQGALLQSAIRTIPFMNARIQGLYKIGRTAADKKTQGNLVLRGMLLTTIAGILHAMNADDEKYKDLRDFERLQYLNFMNVPGIGHIRVPLPFELGAMFGSLPIYFGQLATGSIDEKQMWEVIKDTVVDTFRMDIPQFAKPLFQQWANKNIFTGGRIETMGDIRVEPRARWNAKTSKISRAIGGYLDVSPKRIDQLVKDYFAGVGQTGLYMMDQGLKWVTDYPEDPAITVGERYISGVGRFIKGTAAPYSTKTQQKFYDFLAEADMANSTLNAYKTIGDIEGAKALLKSKKHALRYKKYLTTVQKTIRKYNQQIKVIALRKGMSAAEKQKKIDVLLIKRNALFKKAVKLRSKK